MRLGRVALVPVAVLVIAVGAALLIPFDSLREPLETAASRALQREVQIRGHLRLAVVPELGLSLQDVSIANAKGAKDPEMIRVGKVVVVGADLASLLAGHLRITKVVLKEPTIHLETAGNGVANWQVFEDGAGAAESASTSVNLSIEKARIEDGTISYFDARSGKRETLDAVNLTLNQPTGNDDVVRPVAVTGSATYRAVPTQFSATLANAESFVRGKLSNAAVRASSDKFTAAFTGELSAAGAAKGDLTFNAPSLRRLAAWAGQPLPPGNGFGAIELHAALSAVGGIYKLSNAKITLDNVSAGGDVSVDTLHNAVKAELRSIVAYGGTGKVAIAIDASGAVPSIRETLDMSGVQIAPFLQQVMGVSKLRATGAVHLDVSSRGLTESDILHSLDGSGAVRLANGAITGVDLGGVARLLQSTAHVLDAALGDSSRTDFTALSGTFTFRKGVAQTSDLQMTTPTFNITGVGWVNLATRQVDFHIVPKAQLGVAGVNLVDVGVPFYVKGTIDNPGFDPDPSGVAKALVGSVGETATGLVDTVGGTAAKALEVPGNAIKSLFGRN